MNLRNKTILLLAPLIIIPILTVGFVSLDKLHKTALNRLTTHTTTLLDQISRHTITSERIAKANLRILSKHHLLKQYSLPEDESMRYELLLPYILTLFENLQVNMPGYLEVKFIRLDGFEDAYWSSGKFKNVNESIAKEWYYNELLKLKDNEKSFVILDENTGEHALLVVRKMFARSNAVNAYDPQLELRGYLAVLLSLADLKSEVNQNIIGETGFLSVINADGKPLLEPDTIESDVVKNTLKSLIGKIAVEKGNETSNININNNVVFASWRELVAGMKLIAVLPEKDLINDSYELGQTVLIITVLAMLAAVFLVLASLRYLILRPIDSLSQAVTKMKNGALDVEININHDDEIGHLAQTFSDMSKSLKQSHDTLHLSHQRLLLQREHTPLAIVEWNTSFECIDWNPAAEYIFGFSKNEVIGHNITDKIFPESVNKKVNEVWDELIANVGGTHRISKNITKNGNTILCEWHNTSLLDEDGCVIGVASLVDDITERQQNEERLRQSQKMDAIGNLTGGIAHDFNNMLGVILGFSELLKYSLNNASSEQIKYCDEIMAAGERAKKLTSQLLEYSRKAPSSEVETHINDLLQNMQHMLEKILTPRIKLIFDLNDSLWPVLLDKDRTENAIINICINAMYAMPSDGVLRIHTNNIKLNKSDSQAIDAPPGDYVMISICDTGTGMSQEVQDKIFDPYFTTKGTDGTGLGMSQVYGFVEQSGGKILVSSELNHGTCIEIYFPRAMEFDNNAQEKVKNDIFDLPSGDETILVVDDEEALLELSDEILTTFGYTVLRAACAEEALEVLKKYSVDLMLTDVIMPGIDGYQLATEVEKLYPNIKIQIASGFSDERKMNLINNTLHQQRLNKPIKAKTLLVTVRHRLDEK